MSVNSATGVERAGNLSEDRLKLLALLLEDQERGAQEIKPYPRDEGADTTRFPTSWSQQRLWFIDRLEGGCRAYHMAFTLRLRGALDESALRAALNAIVE